MWLQKTFPFKVYGKRAFLSYLNASADFSAELMCSVPYFDSYSTKKVWITLIYWNIKFSPFNVHEKKVFFFIIMREVCLFYCSDHLSSCLINTRLIFIYLYIFFWYIYRWKDLRCYLKPEETTLQKISIRWLTKQSSQFELLSYILLWWGVIEMEQT